MLQLNADGNKEGVNNYEQITPTEYSGMLLFYPQHAVEKNAMINQLLPPVITIYEILIHYN